MQRKRLRAPVKTKVKRGDVVKVIAGDEKGQQGKVLRVDLSTGRALVEGLNLVKRHLRTSQEQPHGRIAEMEAPIALSNLARTGVSAEKKAEKSA